MPSTKKIAVFGVLAALVGSASAATSTSAVEMTNYVVNNSDHSIVMTQDSAYPGSMHAEINAHGGILSGLPLRYIGDTIKITNGNVHCVLTVKAGPAISVSPATGCGQAYWTSLPRKDQFGWWFK